MINFWTQVSIPMIRFPLCHTSRAKFSSVTSKSSSAAPQPSNPTSRPTSQNGNAKPSPPVNSKRFFSNSSRPSRRLKLSIGKNGYILRACLPTRTLISLHRYLTRCRILPSGGPVPRAHVRSIGLPPRILTSGSCSSRNCSWMLYGRILNKRRRAMTRNESRGCARCWREILLIVSTMFCFWFSNVNRLRFLIFTLNLTLLLGFQIFWISVKV